MSTSSTIVRDGVRPEGCDGRVRPMHRLMLLLGALENGIEVGIDGVFYRLFCAGAVVRLPAGYFRLEEDRVLRRLQRAPHSTDPTHSPHSAARVGGASAGVDQVYVDEGLTINGLLGQAQRLSDESVARIAAASHTALPTLHVAQHTAGARQAGHGGVVRGSAQVLPLFASSAQT